MTLNNIYELWKKTACIIIFSGAFITSSGQKILWANKLLEYTDRYQYENNNAILALGTPSIYPSGILDQSFDPYTEGYILNYQKTSKRNVMVVAFEKVFRANQILIGGVFNPGTIEEIYVVSKDNKEKRVFKETNKPGKVKFKSFSLTIPETDVYGLRLVLNHSKINGWNIIKGIGLGNSPTPLEVAPNNVPGAAAMRPREKLEENINSHCNDFAPKISPNGKILYFVRECPGKEDQDIFFTQLDSTGKWTPAQDIGKPLNNEGYNFVASVSPEGKYLLLGNTYKEDGSADKDGVSTTTKDENGNWKVPEAIKIPDYNNLSTYANFYLGPKGDILIMAIQDKNSVGDMDLYFSRYDSRTNSWSAPQNLGLSVNTPFAEDYPYIANDNQTLYFSSRGYVGYGGLDIMMTKRLDDTWTNWETPKNLGPMINTKRDDKGFVIANDGEHAFYNSPGPDTSMYPMDIFRVDLPENLRQKPRTIVSGKLISVRDRVPVKGIVIARDKEGNIEAFANSSSSDGSFAFALPYGAVYDISVEAPDYTKLTEQVAVNDENNKLEMVKDFRLRRVADSLGSEPYAVVLFGYNERKFTPEFYEELNKIANALKEQKALRYEVSGHTDSIGSNAYNKKLSMDRANAVVKYLSTKGIRSTRLVARGYGETLPAETNSTDEGRAKNRRVEVTPLKSKDQPEFRIKQDLGLNENEEKVPK